MFDWLADQKNKITMTAATIAVIFFNIIYTRI
jgi:hypothetical protein